MATEHDRPRFRARLPRRKVSARTMPVPFAIHQQFRTDVRRIGIRAARRQIRDRFGRAARTEPITRRPGHRFYVTTFNGDRAQLLMGPYVSHMSALDAVSRARTLLARDRPDAFCRVGTASLPTSLPTRYGR